MDNADQETPQNRIPVPLHTVHHPIFSDLSRASSTNTVSSLEGMTSIPQSSSSIDEQQHEGPEGPPCIVCTLPLSPSTHHRTRVLPCKHEFHHKCILRWFLKVDVPTCCLCKQKVEGVDVRDD